jgi:hypothetical protein
MAVKRESIRDKPEIIAAYAPIANEMAAAMERACSAK